MAAAREAAVHRWCSPFPAFTSGHDPRTSDNALLVLFHGGMVRAVQHGWLNAGRRLIDRTYVDMLWHVQSLTALRSCTPEQVAAALDNFVRDEIAPWWVRIPTLDAAARTTLACHLVERATQTLFGSLRSEVAASRLLFYLCPQLPVFPFGRGQLVALIALGAGIDGDADYAAFEAGARSILERMPRALAGAPPAAAYGDDADRDVIDELVRTGDWWQRRVFDALLQRIASMLMPERSDLFACRDDGRPT